MLLNKPIIKDYFDEILTFVKATFSKSDYSKGIWFGNASYVDVLNNELIPEGYSVDYIIDNNPDYKGQTNKEIYFLYEEERSVITNHKTLPILSSSEVSEMLINRKLDDYIFFTASNNNQSMRNALIKIGVSKDRIFSFAIGIDDLIKNESDVRQLLSSNPRELDIEGKQEVAYHILKAFAEFCDKYNLRYHLAFGTLIGAVRHKGFIPWDDDVDVTMPYQDYLKFQKLYPKYNQSQYVFLDWTTDGNYPFNFGKLYDPGTILFHRGFPIQMAIGMYIDIFPFVGLPEELINDEYWNHNKAMSSAWIRAIVLKNMYGFDQAVVHKHILDDRYKYDYKDTKYSSINQTINFKNFHVNSSYYYEDELLEFEDDRFRVPKEYDKALTMRYGDYMKLPPVEDRYTHSFDTYKFDE